ncbi:GNAT family protein [Actinomadura sp. 6K520]|uniref:GNAT family N-acetyltransferase n=1 Tax=Actinomadura sp. 6K520 TaxID=2530364 RepID=UPI001FB5E56B|nr:GNAT family protein [Actinomadura sp. 6K520]
MELPTATMTALLNNDLTTASTTAGVRLTGYFVTDEAKALWRFRLDQLAREPEHARWIVRAAVAEPEGVVVGHAGFQGAPTADGRVEVAYSVDPAHRRRGYARAMLAALLARAAAEPSVTTVRASISPDNAASLATIAGHGFVHVGEQWDERDGRELLFDRPAR